MNSLQKNDNQHDYVLTPNILSAMAGNLVGLGMLSLIFGVMVGVWLSSVVAGAAVFLGLTVVTNLLGYMNLKATEYRFESNQLEYYEGFINIAQSNVAYDRVTDITLQQPITQRIFGTGTIRINTAGSDAQEISISYIDDPEQEYQKIKEITGN